MTVSYEVVWKGPVHKTSGLGLASREYVKALRRQGIRTTIHSAKRKTSIGTKKRRVLVYHFSPNTLNIKNERKHFKTIILNTVWETTRIPARWVRPLNQADAVCVPSTHNKQALRNSGIKKPIFIVPHGVHAHLFSPARLSQNTRFTFISVFGFQHRKNPEALLRAYWEEFSASDRVQLIIKTNGYAPYENERWIRNRIEGYKTRLNIRKITAPIHIITRHMNAKAQRKMFTQGNAFVLPTRGEGVGLPFLESMASGIPVITTSWGGQMDFLTHQNSFLVPYKLLPPAIGMNRSSSIARQFRSLFTGKGQLWAEVDIASLRRQMRKAYQNPHLCRIKGRQARRDALHMSWDRAGRSLRNAIEQTLRKRRK